MLHSTQMVQPSDHNNNDSFNLKPTVAEPTDINIYAQYGLTEHMDAHPDLYWEHSKVCNYTVAQMIELIRRELECDYPLPGSYDVLIRHYTIPECTSSGIYIPKDDIQDSTNFTATIGKVLAIGPEAYRSKGKFPSGNNRCLVGQYCEFIQYNNKAKMVGDYAISIISDDQIRNILPSDPSNLSSVKKIG